eukprot:SAG31_NODE_3369_length_4354_cov_4.327380_6_plen_146_part_00
MRPQALRRHRGPAKLETDAASRVSTANEESLGVSSGGDRIVCGARPVAHIAYAVIALAAAGSGMLMCSCGGTNHLPQQVHPLSPLSASDRAIGAGKRCGVSKSTRNDGGRVWSISPSCFPNPFLDIHSVGFGETTNKCRPRLDCD